MAIPDPMSWALCIHKRALYINKKALCICNRAQHIRTQDNGSAYPPKKPYSPAKEPYTWTKEPCVSAKEPYTFELKTMDQHIPPHRQYSPAKEPYTYIAIPDWMWRHRMWHYRVASWDVTSQGGVLGYLWWNSCVIRMISCIRYRYIHRHTWFLVFSSTCEWRRRMRRYRMASWDVTLQGDITEWRHRVSCRK